MLFDTGQTIVRRGLHPDGRVTICAAARVISHDERGRLLWADPRSHLIKPTTLDGTGGIDYHGKALDVLVAPDRS